MQDALRAGIAVYNAGEYHAAHDAWEDYWLDLEAGTTDERFLHGLIQFTAAVHHAQDCNWVGLRGLAESASEYLSAVPDAYQGVNVDEVRTYLDALAGDPEYIERVAPPSLLHEGGVVSTDDLRFPAATIAAELLAEEYGRYDEAVIEDAGTFGQADLAANESSSPFVTLVMDFVADAEQRDLIYQRLTEHVDRRRSREADVEGLFDV